MPSESILSQWLRAAEPSERERLAALAGTTVGYLYQVAGGSRGTRLSAVLCFAIADASEKLHAESLYKLPVLPARDIAVMSSLAGL